MVIIVRDFLDVYGAELLTKMLEHLSISMTALVIGAIIAVPLGIVASRNKKFSQIMIGVSSVLQTIPSLALLAIVVPFMGVGRTPAVFALVIYSLLPILPNTEIGMESVDKNNMDAG